MRLATLPESRIPEFAIETLLGSGTGTTYLARAADGSLLVVKKLGTPTGHDSALHDLAESLRTIEHPHLARTFGIDVDADGTVSVIRAYVPGVAFDRWVADASPSARRAARENIAGALAHLHAAGLAHGHIAASNIVISSGSRAMLLDAGTSALGAALNGKPFDRDDACTRDIVRLRTLFGD